MRLTTVGVIFVALVVHSNALSKKLNFRKVIRPILTVKENLTVEEINTFLPFSIPEDDGNLTKSVSQDGQKTMVINKHIVGGMISTRGQFPYQAALTMDGDWFCGGSLITHAHILTASHCIENASKFSVTLGAQDRDAYEYGRVVQESKRASMHAKYDSELVRNDIAIVYLNSPVRTSNYIKLIRLPRRALALKRYVGYTATISGWGLTSDSSKNTSSVMYNLKMEVVPLITCVQLYGKDSVTTGNLCVKGRDNRATCNGDSGGPLVIRDTDGTIVQIGIVSYGAAVGCSAGYPDVFTRVGSYLNWISTRTDVVLRH